MSWMSRLFQTYENSMEQSAQAEAQMTPIAHMNANAQLEITISEDGEFQAAVPVDKEQAVTLIPVTEASAGRSSGIAPHALCDTLSYLAGDFAQYCQNEKQKKNALGKYESYMANLKKWVESEDTHPKICSIYRYLLKGKVISDLIKAGLVELTADHIFTNKKISGQPYEKVLVRFRVLSEDGNDKTWKDASLIRSYTSYYLKYQQGRKDICYFLGEERTISENHPKGIVAASYGAKLVSANDPQGYTYRGRFQDAEQSYALSYEASQKIHSALTWLTRKQGVFIGTKDKRTFVCWSPEGKKIPDIFDEFDLPSEEDEADLEAAYRRKLKKTFWGYRDQFDEDDSVVIMALDAATTGRLSVTYYHELMASDFLDRIVYWGESCKWFYLKFTEKKKPYFQIETPTFRRIAEYAYGREKGGFVEAEDRVLKEQTQRLVKCMIEKQPIPYSMVKALMLRASMPMAYSRGNRERVLSTACAIINKYYYDKRMGMKGENNDMKLDVNNRDRSYLFGRLLAVYEKAERMTYDGGETREPNAIRFQSAYVNHPFQTWKMLEEQLIPYFQKLTPGLRGYYKKLISDITLLLPEEEIQSLNQELKETYLLGYYLQRAELSGNKSEKKEDAKNE